MHLFLAAREQIPEGIGGAMYYALNEELEWQLIELFGVQYFQMKLPHLMTSLK